MQWDGIQCRLQSSAARRSLSTRCHAGSVRRKKVNVRAQQQDPNSLLRWFENLIYTLRTAPEIGTGTCSVIDAPLPRPVLAHRFDAAAGSILLLLNLADTTVTVDIGVPGMNGDPYDMLVDGPYPAPTEKLTDLTLNGWGYRWIRLSRSDRG
jgi:maltose alpha-D-glucosyltransferase / alpha-amylase